jgi:hypothetical protein
MKNKLLITLLSLCALNVFGQSKNYKFGITGGAYIQHYNGNLGNSFFKFNTTCFAGGSVDFGLYLDRSFDLNSGLAIGDFGYCQTEADKNRIVSVALQCPGCKDRLGMGELRSRMTSGNIAIKYKFANGYLLKENSKFAPYVYSGAGINHLADNMKRNCVNVGNHFTVNAGAGFKFNFTERFNLGYNLGAGCFIFKKVYYTNAMADASVTMDADDIKMERRKDLYLQNSLSFGINF